MRKLFSLFLALVATTTLWAYDFKVNGIFYNVTSSSAPYTVEVTYYPTVDYPYWEENYPYLTNCTIHETVTYNGTTYSVTSIGEYAFKGCSSLHTISIPNSVTSIGIYAFDGCSSLTSVTIPNSVTSIGAGAFSCCKSLTSVTIPNSVTSIGECAFFLCERLTYPVYNAHCFAYMPTSFEGAYTIPDGIKQIAGRAFYCCTSLTSITIPNSVTSIVKGVFERCSSLKSVTIPNSVTSIGDDAFSGCSGLTSVTIGNSVTSIGGCAFADCSSLTSITIPNSVTSIGDGAFYKCSSLTSITIGNSVTTIGGDAFCVCTSLTSVTIPNSVANIGAAAFSFCSSLTSVTIGNSVTSIGGSAFAYCSSLDTLTCLAMTPPALGGDVFYGCDNPTLFVPCAALSGYQLHEQWGRFTTIECISSEEAETEEVVIIYTSTDGNIVTPYDVAAFSANIVSNTYEDGIGTITFDSPVTSIGNSAFKNCSSLTSVTIPNSVTSIGRSAFRYCTSLTSITIPNSVTSIGGEAFMNCSSLTSVTIPESVMSIGYWAFFGCSSLTSMVVAEGNTVFDSRENCNAIIHTATNDLVAGCQNTIIPNSVTSIGSSAFYGCSSLTSITIPNSVTSIGGEAFAYCSSLTSITIPNSVTSIEGYAFNHCTSLTSITIPNSVTSIGEEAFWGCTSLTSVTIPNSVTNIGDDAFSGCSSLTSVTIGSGVTSIGDGAFANCRSLDTLTCLAMTPPALLGEDVFYRCDNPTLYVPCEALPDYQAHEQWGQFTTIECIASEEAETEEVVVESGTTTVIITWPTEEGADTYTIVIKKDGEVVCTLTFNSAGQLINIAFAPGRNGNHPAQYAEQAGNGYRFTVTSLESGTKYGYNIEVKDASNKTIKSHSGEFTTQSTTAVDNITTNNANIQKIMRDGQFIIVRDGVEYNAVGQAL